jgi:protein subunit release factor A
MKVTEDQFIYEWFSGTGKGGQHRNKHQNCCRCIHEPTGITANGTGSRSREDNKRDAYTTCRSRVEAYYHQDTERYQAGHDRIRTYHAADNRVVDHASGHTDTFQNVIEKHAMEDMIKARAEATREQ